jgi:serine/threonine protein kinase
MEQDGNEQSAFVLLPLYFDFLYIVIAYSVMVSILCIAAPWLIYNPMGFGVQLGMYHMLYDGVWLFYTQYGAGFKAILRSAIFGLSCFIITLVSVLYAAKELYEGNEWGWYRIFLALNLFFAALYASPLLIPQRFFYRRPAMTTYSIMQLVYYMLYLTFTTMIYMREASGYCLCASVFILFDCIIRPITLYRSLSIDSQYWQGGDGKDHLSIIGPWSLNAETANAIAGVHSRTQGVHFVHFGHISLSKGVGFVAGGFSRVYFGKYKNRKIALKMLFVLELNPGSVNQFCREAQILRSLRHGNVIECIGVSVMPPAVCVVLEFCEKGSLFDFMHKLRTVQALASTNVSVLSPNRLSMGPSKAVRKSITSAGRIYAPAASFGPSANNPLQDESVANRPSISGVGGFELISPGVSVASNRLSEGGSADVSYPAAAGGGGAGAGGEGYDNGRASVSGLAGGSTRNPLQESLIGTSLQWLELKSHLHSSDNVQFDVPQEVKMLCSPSGSLGCGARDQSRSVDGINNNMSERTSSHGGINRNSTPAASFIPAPVFISSLIHSSELSPSLLVPERSTTGKELLRTDVPLTLVERLPAIHDLSLSGIIEVMRDVARGVAFLHSRKWMHCDLKSLNFLVTENFRVKLADMGESRSVSDPVESSAPPPIPALNWCPPEVLADGASAKDYTMASDVYGLAMVLVEIITLEIPFDNHMVKKGTYEAWYRLLTVENARPKLPKDILPDNLVSILQMALSSDPSMRPSAGEILAVLDGCAEKTTASGIELV